MPKLEPEVDVSQANSAECDTLTPLLKTEPPVVPPLKIENHSGKFSVAKSHYESGKSGRGHSESHRVRHNSSGKLKSDGKSHHIHRSGGSTSSKHKSKSGSGSHKDESEKVRHKSKHDKDRTELNGTKSKDKEDRSEKDRKHHRSSSSKSHHTSSSKTVKEDDESKRKEERNRDGKDRTDRDRERSRSHHKDRHKDKDRHRHDKDRHRDKRDKDRHSHDRKSHDSKKHHERSKSSRDTADAVLQPVNNDSVQSVQSVQNNTVPDMGSPACDAIVVDGNSSNSVSTKNENEEPEKRLAAEDVKGSEDKSKKGGDSDKRKLEHSGSKSHDGNHLHQRSSSKHHHSSSSHHKEKKASSLSDANSVHPDSGSKSAAATGDGDSSNSNEIVLKTSDGKTRKVLPAAGPADLLSKIMSNMDSMSMMGRKSSQQKEESSLNFLSR